MNNNTKKYLIYLRYSLPIAVELIIFAMLFVPSYRFVFSGTVGEKMSASSLISNSWEQARQVLFGTAENTDAAMIFSRILFALIIALALLMIFSLCISVWSAYVAFKCFLSDDEEDSERSRRTLNIFVPNRIALCIFYALGLLIAIFPYLMKPIYAFTYSQKVSLVLEAPDALIVGGILLLAIFLLSIICAPIERDFGADIFEKADNGNEPDADEPYTEADDNGVEDIDSEAMERIRRLFYDGNNDKDNRDNNDK